MRKNRYFSIGNVNIITTVLSQLVSIACGVIVPRLLIRAYGSEAYGISVSIAQFLAYIELMEGGVCGVARGKLYGPMAAGNQEQVNAIYGAIQTFFRGIAAAFLGYSLVLAFSYHELADVTIFSKEYIFVLVLAISAATLTKYMFGIANLTLLISAQKQYIHNLTVMAATIGTTIVTVVMVFAGFDLLWVKLGSSLVFVIRPLIYWFCVRRYFPGIRKSEKKAKLEQKWTGLGQHLAYFIHSNTDVILLTLMASTEAVAVYAVYNMVIRNIRNLTEACVGGMEAAFGKAIAQQKHELLHRYYRRYQALITAATVVLFGCTGILIVPFVKLYTSGITDTDYIQPAFAVVLLMAEVVNCLCLPCSTLPVAAGRLKQTKWGSYAEVIANVGLSCLLIRWDPLLGVAIGTLTATVIRAIYYVVYSTQHLLKMSIWKNLVLFVATIVGLCAIILTGASVVEKLCIESYNRWILCGFGCFVTITIPILGVVWRMSRRSKMEKAKNDCII